MRDINKDREGEGGEGCDRGPNQRCCHLSHWYLTTRNNLFRTWAVELSGPQKLAPSTVLSRVGGGGGGGGDLSHTHPESRREGRKSRHTSHEMMKKQ